MNKICSEFHVTVNSKHIHMKDNFDDPIEAFKDYM
jgi:hypothetical protein